MLKEREIKEGYKRCPHCHGKTTCSCGTCGVQKPFFWRGKNEGMTVDGICKVCHGQGQVPK